MHKITLKFSLSLITTLLFVVFFAAQTATKPIQKMSYEELKTQFYDLYDNNKLKEAEKYAKVYLAKAKNDKDKEKIANGYYFYSFLKHDNIKLTYLDSCLSENITNKIFPASIYFQKGVYYFSNNKFKLSLNNYIQCENTALLNKNINLAYLAKSNIAMIRSEKVGDVKGTLKSFHDIFDYYSNQKYHENSLLSNLYLNSIFSLADSYKFLNNLDSANFYNELGLKESRSLQNNHFNGLFLINIASVDIEFNNYEIALIKINKSLPLIKEAKDSLNILSCYYYYGKIYEKLNNHSKAIVYYQKVDSIYNKNTIIYPEVISGYRFLIDNSKNKNEKLYYLNQLLKIENELKIEYKDLISNIYENYDTPNLLIEKESLIQDLKKDKQIKLLLIFSISLLLVLSLVFGILSLKKQKQYRLQFEKIINQADSTKNTKHSIQEKKELDILEEIINDILKKLEVFEAQNHFLDNSISLSRLAKKFNTNSKYLSQIINLYKDSNFPQYINRLRIQYTLEQLKNNSVFRKYTIQALAEEAGFNNSESFSKAFKVETGLKPSYFLKQLEMKEGDSTT